MDFLLRNATIINEMEMFRANVFISNGIIDKIDRTLSISGSANCKEIDMSELVLMPGVIDDQVHFREPGLTHKADIFSESRAAVAGGVTSFMDMPNTSPQTISCQLLEDKYNIAQGRAFANYSFFIGATNSNIDELKNVDVHTVPGVKVFMGSSTGNMLVDNISSLEKLFSEIPLLIAVHAEDEATVKQNLVIIKEKYGENPPADVHPLIRSAEACYITSSKAVELAKKYNSRLHLLHITTEKEMSLLSAVPLAFKRITAEVCVHHLWFDDNDYAEKGNFIKCNPAIKTERDKLALRKALNDGLLDVVATDHAPHTLEEKNNPYYSSPSGMPSVQHSLLAMLELSRRGFFPLNKIPQWMAHNPAECFKIQNRGFIREGYAADLVAVDLHAETHVTNDNSLYKCGWTPFDGITFSSKICYTFVNGNIAFDGKQVVHTPFGKQMYFN